MYDWQDFDSVFHSKSDLSPDTKHAEASVRHRKELGGTLFFDRMWSALRLGKVKQGYPPKSNADLRNLWKSITHVQAPDEQKLALLYYLILDTRKQTLQQTFAQKSFLPQKYQILVTGLWQLDQCHFPQALEYLTSPSMIPLTFGDEVLAVLLRHPKCDNSLAMAYYLTVRPPLSDQSALDAYFGLLAETNITESFRFARQQPQHKRLFEALIISVYSMKPGEARATAAKQLIGLPFSDDEERWFEESLLRGEPSKTPGAKDSVLARRLANGQSTTDGHALARFKGNKINGVNWEDIRALATG